MCKGVITNCCQQRYDNADIVTGDWRPLACEFYPLRFYNAKRLFTFITKEVSVIECTNLAKEPTNYVINIL